VNIIWAHILRRQQAVRFKFTDSPVPSSTASSLRLLPGTGTSLGGTDTWTPACDESAFPSWRSRCLLHPAHNQPPRPLLPITPPAWAFPAFPFTTVPGPTHSCLAPSKPPQPPPCESPLGRELSIPPAALLSVVRPFSSPVSPHLEPRRHCLRSPVLVHSSLSSSVGLTRGNCLPLSQAASCGLVFPSTSRFAPSLEVTVVQSRAHSLAVLRILAPLFNHQANPGLHFVPYLTRLAPPKAPQKLHPSIRPPFDSLVRIQCKRGLGSRSVPGRVRGSIISC
jgi:hypothetical protein